MPLIGASRGWIWPPVCFPGLLLLRFCSARRGLSVLGRGEHLSMLRKVFYHLLDTSHLPCLLSVLFPQSLHLHRKEQVDQGCEEGVQAVCPGSLQGLRVWT